MALYQPKRYLISGPGRVGGHIVKGIVRSAGQPVLHTHDPFLETDDDSITCLVVVDRRDVFSAIMSNIIVWHTGQSTDYGQKIIEPFTADEYDFIEHYRRHIWHAPNLDYSRPWANVVHFCFEDFVNNEQHVLDRLGLVQRAGLRKVSKDINHLIDNPAPYNYRDIIVNHEYLWQLYQQIRVIPHENPYDRDDTLHGKKENEIFE